LIAIAFGGKEGWGILFPMLTRKVKKNKTLLQQWVMGTGLGNYTASIRQK
jgi:hypothetical protein